MTPSARSEVSKSYTDARGVPVSSLTEAAQAAGTSLRALAQACGFTHSYLSQLAKGDRPVSAEVAGKILALTHSTKFPEGWSAWPRRKSG